MDLNECMIHTKTQQDYDDLFDFLLNNDIISETVYSNWMSNNNYTSYEENTVIALQTEPTTTVQFCRFDYYKENAPWKHWSYKTIEEVLGPREPQEPFIKTITMEDIYNGKIN